MPLHGISCMHGSKHVLSKPAIFWLLPAQPGNICNLHADQAQSMTGKCAHRGGNRRQTHARQPTRQRS